MPLSVGPRVLDPELGIRCGYYLYDDDFAGVVDLPMGKVLEFKGIVTFGIQDHHGHPTLAALLAEAVDLSICKDFKCVEKLLESQRQELKVGVNYSLPGRPRMKLQDPWIVFSRSLHRIYASPDLEPRGYLGWFGTILDWMGMERFYKNLNRVLEEYASLGYISVTDMYTLPDLLPRGGPIELKRYCPIPGCDGMKVFVDGTLEGRDILLDPIAHGECPFRDGVNVAAHAMGDGAVDILLKSCSGRFRIEHAMVLRDDQIKEIAERGITVCIQPSFLELDEELAPRVLGERISLAFRFGSLEKQGVKVLIGSDFPIGDPHPIRMLRLATGLRAPEWFRDPMSLEGYLRGLVGADPKTNYISIVESTGVRSLRIDELLPS